MLGLVVVTERLSRPLWNVDLFETKASEGLHGDLREYGSTESVWLTFTNWLYQNYGRRSSWF